MNRLFSYNNKGLHPATTGWRLNLKVTARAQRRVPTKFLATVKELSSRTGLINKTILSTVYA